MSNIHQVNGYRSDDGSSRPMRLDEITNAIQVVDQVHHEIHAGYSFMYHDVIASLGDTTVQDYWIITPDTTQWIHSGHSIESTGPFTLEIFEGADRTSAKTLQTVFNRNRNSLNTATAAVYKNDNTGASTGGSTDGTRIVWWKGGVANNKVTNGASAGSGNEKILKQNTAYIIRITSGMAANLISVAIDWYEHANVL